MTLLKVRLNVWLLKLSWSDLQNTGKKKKHHVKQQKRGCAALFVAERIQAKNTETNMTKLVEQHVFVYGAKNPPRLRRMPQPYRVRSN